MSNEKTRVLPLYVVCHPENYTTLICFGKKKMAYVILMKFVTRLYHTCDRTIPDEQKSNKCPSGAENRWNAVGMPTQNQESRRKSKAACSYDCIRAESTLMAVGELSVSWTQVIR